MKIIVSLKIKFVFFFAVILLAGCKEPQVLESTVTPVIELKDSEKMYEETIANWEQMEKDSPSQKGAIVFTGSSSIRKWDSLKRDMAPLPVINRGFGGSTLRLVNAYATRIIVPLRPKIIVLYCGENDIANDLSEASLVLKDFKTFKGIIDQYLPETTIIFISMKPSPLRWNYWEKFKEGNAMVEGFAKEIRGVDYLDVGDVMLDPSGRPKREIWLKDSLHMNQVGYEAWTAKIKPVLEGKFSQ